MTLTLELSPAEEREIATDAEREGVSLVEYARRRLLVKSATMAEPTWKAKLRAGQEIARREFAASGKSDAELGREIDEEIKLYRRERAETDNALVSPTF